MEAEAQYNRGKSLRDPFDPRPEREGSHVGSLENALAELRSTRRSATDLMNDIQGRAESGQKLDDSGPRAVPSLASLLLHAPDEIHSECAQIKEVLMEIRGALRV